MRAGPEGAEPPGTPRHPLGQQRPVSPWKAGLRFFTFQEQQEEAGEEHGHTLWQLLAAASAKVPANQELWRAEGWKARL